MWVILVKIRIGFQRYILCSFESREARSVRNVWGLKKGNTHAVGWLTLSLPCSGSGRVRYERLKAWKLPAGLVCTQCSPSGLLDRLASCRFLGRVVGSGCVVLRDSLGFYVDACPRVVFASASCLKVGRGDAFFFLFFSHARQNVLL